MKDVKETISEKEKKGSFMVMFDFTSNTQPLQVIEK